MHTHVEQRAYLPEDCPACAALWEILERKSSFNVQEEIDYARQLLSEYGPPEAIHHLTDVRELFLRDTYGK